MGLFGGMILIITLIAFASILFWSLAYGLYGLYALNNLLWAWLIALLKFAFTIALKITIIICAILYLLWERLIGKASKAGQSFSKKPKRAQGMLALPPGKNS